MDRHAPRHRGVEPEVRRGRAGRRGVDAPRGPHGGAIRGTGLPHGAAVLSAGHAARSGGTDKRRDRARVSETPAMLGPRVWVAADRTAFRYGSPAVAGRR